MTADCEPLSTLRAGPIAPHRHLRPYAAILRTGGYAQGDGCMRFELRPGMVAFHPVLSFHANIVGEAGALVHNVPLPSSTPLLEGVFEWPGVAPPTDADELLSWCALATRVPCATAPDWLEGFATLSNAMPVADAARAVGVSREHAARAYGSHFLMSPVTARQSARLRLLLKELTGTAPLAACALAAGYADQAHMTRTVRTATGMSPTQLRRWLRRH